MAVKFVYHKDGQAVTFDTEETVDGTTTTRDESVSLTDLMNKASQEPPKTEATERSASEALLAHLETIAADAKDTWDDVEYICSTSKGSRHFFRRLAVSLRTAKQLEGEFNAVAAGAFLATHGEPGDGDGFGIGRAQ